MFGGGFTFLNMFVLWRLNVASNSFLVFASDSDWCPIKLFISYRAADFVAVLQLKTLFMIMMPLEFPQ